jgi:hypothetical protein
MSVLAPALSLRWLARPLILAVAVLLALFAATGFLGLQYLQQRQAANHLLAQSREVLVRSIGCGRHRRLDAEGAGI